MPKFDYDFFVIGAGSGGVRAARTAADLGVRVGIAENRDLGGTCVNLGCVPKKLFFYASQFSEEFRASQGFGWNFDKQEFSWSTLMANKNQEINRLKNIYGNLLEKSGVELYRGKARILDEHRVQIDSEVISSERILIATGGKPTVPDITGSEHVATSDDIFALQHLPQRMIVVGGGYIACEFAGIFHGLGVDTTLVYRRDKLLRGFDEDIRTFVGEEMQKKGIKILFETDINSIAFNDQIYEAKTEHGETLTADLIFYAIGRIPNVSNLGLEEIGVKMNKSGTILVNDQYQTNIPSLYALGDVTDRLNLTPVAIAEAMALVYELFGDQSKPVDYQHIPTTVFSQPNVGTVGLAEYQAVDQFDNVDIYRSTFKAMKHTLSGLDEKTMIKMIVNRDDDRVLGIHMVGPEAGEIIQGLAVAIRADATKSVFDSTIGIHPTLAEEFVTMRKPVKQYGL